MSAASSRGSMKPGPSEDYKALLRGEISSAEYVKRMKANVDARHAARPPSKWPSPKRRKRRDRNTEKAREVAFNAHLDGMHFHEVAIRDPFEAEREYQALAQSIVSLLGPPKGVRVVEFKP